MKMWKWKPGRFLAASPNFLDNSKQVGSVIYANVHNGQKLGRLYICREKKFKEVSIPNVNAVMWVSIFYN